MIKNFKLFEESKNSKKNDILVIDTSPSFLDYVNNIINDIDFIINDNFDCYFGEGYNQISIQQNTNLEQLRYYLNKPSMRGGGGGDSIQSCIDDINKKYSNKNVIIVTDGWNILNMKNSKNYFSVLYTDNMPVYKNIKKYYTLELDSYKLDFLYEPEDNTIEIYKMYNNSKKFNL